MQNEGDGKRHAAVGGRGAVFSLNKVGQDQSAQGDWTVAGGHITFLVGNKHNRGKGVVSETEPFEWLKGAP
jgi:hypothetical protein